MIGNSVTFYAAGTYQFQITITDNSGMSASSTVNVTVVPTIATVTLTPATVTLLEGATQQFAASAYDQFHNLLSTQPVFNWTMVQGPGLVSSSGLYTAPTSSTGTAIVGASATVNGVMVSGTATVTVVAPGPVISNISASPNPVTGTKTTLSVVATDPSGGILSYTWSVLSQPAGTTAPTFNASHASLTTATFHAAGTYTFQVVVTSSLTGESTTATVSVTVVQTLTRVAVSPASFSVKHGTSLPLAAYAYDQFGNQIFASFTWSMVSGPGSVNKTGLYTAPLLGTGKAVVKATATINGITLSGTTTLTIT